MSRMIRLLACGAIVLVCSVVPLVVGCGRPAADRPASTLTEAQRDSVLARSAIPGAGAVGRALDASDKAGQRAAGMDSLTR